MANTISLIGAYVRKGDRVGKVESIGKPFPGGAQAVYVVGDNNSFADWWLIEEITIAGEEVSQEEVAANRPALTA